VIPYGRLREGPEGAARADMIVITKCPPHLEEEEMMRFENGIKKYSSKPVFFSKIRYAEPIAFGELNKILSTRVVLLSAIANSHIFEEDVKKSYTVMKHFSFRDHYEYSINDLKEVENFWKENQNEPLCILTTEKDKVKLERDDLKSIISRLPIFYLPIETEFIINGNDFDTLVLTFVDSFKHS
jgi:tetraacyldisaccharide 4'-kinase